MLLWSELEKLSSSYNTMSDSHKALKELIAHAASISPSIQANISYCETAHSKGNTLKLTLRERVREEEREREREREIHIW